MKFVIGVLVGSVSFGVLSATPAEAKGHKNHHRQFITRVYIPRIIGTPRLITIPEQPAIQ